jgi:predicted metal-dependent hydrolase
MASLIQLAFDWLDSAPAAPRASLPAPTSTSKPNLASLTEPTLVVHKSRGSIPEPQFKHTRANRQACLAQTWVAYEFKRARRRTIGFLVDADGLVVRAPNWVTIAEMESALQEKAVWVVRKLQEAQERQQQLAGARISWRDGVTFPYLGGTLLLKLDPSQQHARHAMLVGDTLCLGLSQSASAEQIRDAVQAWLMSQAREHFVERLNHYAPLLGVSWRKLSLSNAGTRWGSAKSDGSIRLNWRLLHFKPSVIDYVVAHELSHLRVMNHSPAFWDTVKTLVPDYDQQRLALRDELLPAW